MALTDVGIRAIEKAFGCGNLFDDKNFPIFTAVQQAIHAHALLRRDVDYIAKDGVIESVDEFKGPHRRGAAMALWLAYGNRGERACGSEKARKRPRIDHSRKSDLFLVAFSEKRRRKSGAEQKAAE